MAIFTPKGYAGILEFLIVIIELIYVFYAFMLTRQTKLMNHSFYTPSAGTFTMLAGVHFLAAIGVVIVTILLA
jgi:hypothetical protein